MRLGDLGRTLSPRRCIVYIRQLPPDSALGRKVNPDGWTVDTYLLAAAVDALHGANWQRGQDSTAKRPQPVPRPGVEEDRRSRFQAQAEAFRARQQEGGVSSQS